MPEYLTDLRRDRAPSRTRQRQPKKLPPSLRPDFRRPQPISPPQRNFPKYKRPPFEAPIKPRYYPLESKGKFPMLPALALPVVGGMLDGYFRRPLGDIPLPTFPNDQWILRHGPNTYLQPNYVAQNHQPVVQWKQANLEAGPTGPETGHITGQAISSSARRPLGTTPLSSDSRQSYWIQHDTITRYAQYLAWQKLNYPRDSYSETFTDWDALHPKPAVVMPDPFILPPKFDLPPNPLPDVVVPLPREHPSPRPRPKPAPAPPPPADPPIWNRDFHDRNPPRQNEKERKGKIRKTFDKVMDIFGAVTEIGDIVDAAWKSLPSDCRTKTYYKGRIVTSAQDRWADVYRCAPHMDIDQFLRNLINNHFQDLMIGIQNRIRNKLLPDGINGIDILRWVDEFMFDGELGRNTDLSQYLYQLETEYAKNKGK